MIEDRFIVLEYGMYCPAIRTGCNTTYLPCTRTLIEAQRILGISKNEAMIPLTAKRVRTSPERERFIEKLREEDENEGNIQDW